MFHFTCSTLEADKINFQAKIQGEDGKMKKGWQSKACKTGGKKKL